MSCYIHMCSFGTCHAQPFNWSVLTRQGQVLNQTSAWWMDQTRHIISNSLVGVPDPNIAVMQRCSVFPVEFVVRGYLTGALKSLKKVIYSIENINQKNIQLFSKMEY